MSSERVVVAILKPAAGKEARVEEILVGLTEKVHANEPGALRYHLHKEIESDDPQFVFIETYKDKPAHTAHRETDYFKAAFKEMADAGLLGGPPTIVRCASFAGFESR